MTSSRPGRLRTLLLCFAVFCGSAARAQQAPPAAPPPQAPPTQAPPPQNRANPFENVPQAPEPEAPKPTAPKPEAAKPTAGGQPTAPPQDVIEAINFNNVRRVPQDTLRSQILSKAGDKFDKDA